MWMWGIAGVVALVWPDRITGPLHGIPLDDVVGALTVGLAVPLLWWLHPAFLRMRRAHISIVALLAWKLFSSVALVQDGWCVHVLPNRVYAKDAAGAPHSWDARADWRSADPACSAVMTRPYRALSEFPVWFFNLPPPSDNLPSAEDRPPAAHVDMTIQGFLYTPRPGQVDVAANDDVRTTLYVDGGAASRATIAPGLHAVVIDASMTGDRWALVPRFDNADLWSAGVPTIRRPSRMDVLVRPWGKWITVVLAAGFVLLWAAAALRRTLDDIRNPRHLPDHRGALLVIGIPWLVFAAVRGAPLVGRMTLYSAGDDFWQFQRYAYRIVMQGYWLEGGSPTFWFQPLYRWIAGLLHLVFGDSSVGEMMWDCWCVLVGALAAFGITKAFAGFRWGLVAAVLTVVVFETSAARTWLGAGLGEISAAGLLYLAVLIVSSDRLSAWMALAAGVLATLAFYTRLNHLVMGAAVAAFAISPQCAAGDLWFPRRWFASISWRKAFIVLGVIGTGMLLLAWRTWHYTGVFSVFYGTQREMLSTIQPGLPLTIVLRRMMASAMMVLTIDDPPRLHLVSMPLIAGVASAALGMLGVPRLRAIPLRVAVLGLSSVGGALFARGAAYLGRFSIHAIPITCALTVCAAAALAGTARRAESSDLEATDADRA